MKKKVDLVSEIFAETHTRYPHIDWRKFEVLYHGWRQQGKRHGRNSQFYTLAWRRGWLSEKDADDFRKYIGIH